MKSHVWTAALAAIALAGCGSPADSLDFHAPSGWNASPGILGFTQAWTSPDQRQTLILMKLPVPMKASDILQGQHMSNGKVDKQQQIMICGNQPAAFVSASAVGQHNNLKEERTLDMVMTSASSKTYVAMYVRPVHAVAEADAETAIRSLCDKK